MFPDEFHLFSTYLYLFGDKCVKSKLSISWVFLMYSIHMLSGFRQMINAATHHFLSIIITLLCVHPHSSSLHWTSVAEDTSSPTMKVPSLFQGGFVCARL